MGFDNDEVLSGQISDIGARGLLKSYSYIQTLFHITHVCYVDQSFCIGIAGYGSDQKILLFWVGKGCGITCCSNGLGGLWVFGFFSCNLVGIRGTNWVKVLLGLGFLGSLLVCLIL